MGNLKQIRLLTLDDVLHFSTKGKGTCVPYTLQRLLISYSAMWHKRFALSIIDKHRPDHYLRGFSFSSNNSYKFLWE